MQLSKFNERKNPLAFDSGISFDVSTLQRNFRDPVYNEPKDNKSIFSKN